MSIGFKLSKIYQAGYCLGLGGIADRTLPWKRMRFYARSFLLKHPSRGLILIDTGYGDALLEATKRGIYSLYSRLLPVTFRPEDSVVYQLAQDGICIADLSYLFITHFHPDHIGALPEFSKVPWVFRSEALETLLSFSSLRGLLSGFIRPLVPKIPSGSVPILNRQFTQSWNSFSSYDLFGDGSLHLIDLPGHALGQMGIATNNAFFTADAKWGRGTILPHPLGFLLQHDVSSYRSSFRSLGALSPAIDQYPTHTIQDHA